MHENFGPILYYQHEGPMYVYQCDTLCECIDEFIQLSRHPYASKIDDVHEFRIKPMQTVNNGLGKAVERIDVMDAVRSLVKEAEIDNVYFQDFTGAVTGDGFDLRGYTLLAVLKNGPVIIGKKKSRIMATDMYMNGLGVSRCRSSSTRPMLKHGMTSLKRHGWIGPNG